MSIFTVKVNKPFKRGVLTSGTKRLGCSAPQQAAIPLIKLSYNYSYKNGNSYSIQIKKKNLKCHIRKKCLLPDFRITGHFILWVMNVYSILNNCIIFIHLNLLSHTSDGKVITVSVKLYAAIKQNCVLQIALYIILCNQSLQSLFSFYMCILQT